MEQGKRIKLTALHLSAKSMVSTLLLLFAMLMPQGAWAISGSGTSSSPYLIANEADLRTFQQYVENGNSGIYGKLTANITLTSAWTRIGRADRKFTGYFDGQGHTVSGMNLSFTAYEHGFFGFVNNATIKNFTLKGTMTSSANGNHSHGTVVGSAAGTTVIENVTSSVNLTLNHTGFTCIGGIVGHMDESSKVIGCTYTGTINLNKDSEQVGGIVGYAQRNLYITNNVFSGTITSTGTCKYLAGIAGKTDGTIEVSGCTNIGTINGGPSYDCVAGIVGYVQYQSRALITNCYFGGSLSSTSSGTSLGMGGILGAVNDDAGTNFRGLTYCFSDGTLTATNSSSTQIGGIAGIIKSKAVSKVMNNTYLSGTASRLAAISNNSSTFDSSNKAITISVTAGTGGTVKKSYVYPTSTTATQLQVVATPNSGYHYVKWSDNGVQTHNVSLANNVSLTATFGAHTYGNWSTDVAATCTSTGTHHRVCTYTGCGAREDGTIAAKGHGQTKGYTASYDWQGTASATTCKFTLKCNDCKDSKGNPTVIVNSQSITTTKVQAYHVDATCVKDGNERWTATGSYSKAGDATYNGTAQVKDYAIPAAGHTFNDVTDPHHTLCTVCKHSFFRYTSSTKEAVDPYNADELKDAYDAKLDFTNTYVDGQGVMEFEGTLKTIGDDAFYGCSSFTGNLTIPNSVTYIGAGAFSKCSGFTGNLTIPNSVTYIGESAFYLCSGFTGNLTIPNSVTSIGNNAFFRCSGFTGNLTIPNSVTYIGESAFYLCSGFTGNLTIPNSVTSIGEYAFYGCYGFNGNLTIPNSVTSIGNSAFKSCSSFKGNLTIPNSVTSIGEYAFYGCYGFNGNLTIPNSVTYIGESAFYNCKSFTSVEFLSVPQTGTDAFNSVNCTKAVVLSNDSYVDKGSNPYFPTVASVTAPCTLDLTGCAVAGHRNLTLNHGNEVVDAEVPPTCTSTGLTEGSHCNLCNEIFVARQTIPAIDHIMTEHAAKAPTCTEEGNYLYYTCSRPCCAGLYYKDADLHTSDTYAGLAETVAEKSSHVFDYYDRAHSLCTECNHGFFWYETNNFDINYYDGSKRYNAIYPTGNIYDAEYRQIYMVQSIVDDRGVGFIEFDGPIVHLGDNAFASCEFVGYVYLPNTIVTIGANAFQGCCCTNHESGNKTGISEIDIPSSVTAVGENAFNDIYDLSSINAPCHLDLSNAGIDEEVTITRTGHSFTVKSDADTYLASAAGCVNDATYYYKCANCDGHGTETWAKAGSALGHIWENGECTVCGTLLGVELIAEGETKGVVYPLDEAFEYVKDGWTMKLTGDVTMENNINMDSWNRKNITIDLNGYSIDGTYEQCEDYWDDEAKEWLLVPGSEYNDYRRLSVSGSTTIKNGTIKANIEEGSNDNLLTIDNATVIGSRLSWMSAPGVDIKNNATLHLNSAVGGGQFSFEDCKLDATSKVVLTGINQIGMYGKVPGGYREIIHRFAVPDGYVLKKNDGSDKNLRFYLADDPECTADMKGVTITINGSDPLSECSYSGLEMVQMHNEDCSSYWTDYYPTCPLCFGMTSEGAIVYDKDKEGHVCDHFVLDDSKKYDISVNFTASSVTYTRHNIKNQWGTIVVPFDVTNGDDYDFYTLSSVSGDELTLTKVDGTLAANTPALIRFNSELVNGKTYDLTINTGETQVSNCSALEDVTPTPVDGLTLTGSYSVKDITDENGYIISSNKFWSIQEVKGSNNVYCAPFRAYLSSSSPVGAKQLNIGQGKEATAIEAITAIIEGEAEYYDINGHRINSLQKGVNIIRYSNGKTKKVVIK